MFNIEILVVENKESEFNFFYLYMCIVVFFKNYKLKMENLWLILM